MNITIEQLITCIKESTVPMEVLVPCTDYYARPTDFSKDTLEYVCPDMLLEALASICEEEPTKQHVDYSDEDFEEYTGQYADYSDEDFEDYSYAR